MNRLLCCLFLLSLNVVAFSQKQYFVFVQAETQQPFFVKINEKVYSSSGSDYLILAKLKDSSYIFKIGFPQNKWPEQQFSINIKSKDHGFLLKNFGEKGWGLFDLQTLSVLMPDDQTKDKGTKSGAGEISAFTEILSRAANDPSLKERSATAVKYDEKTLVVQTAVVKEEARPKDQAPVNTVFIEQPVKKRDSSLIAKKEDIKKEETAKIAQEQKKVEQPIAKITDGIKKNADTSTKNEDTAKIAQGQKKTEQLIAKNTEEVKEKADTSASVQQSVTQEEMAIADKTPEKNKMAGTTVGSPASYKKSVITKKSESSTSEGLGLTFIDELTIGDRDTIQIIIPNQTNAISKAKTNDQPAEQRKFLNVTTDEKDISSPTIAAANKRTCSSVASESDFMKLRKKMAAQKTDEQMIDESKKIFKSKCFTTEQVKNLGNLFLNEAGKFQFYETAYPFNIDQNNFVSLQTELKDAYFIHRFKKMIN